MKLKSTLILLCFFLFSCYSTEPEIKFWEIEVPKSQILVKKSEPDQKINEYLHYSGNEIIGHFDLSLHTTNSHYTLYTAVVEAPKETENSMPQRNNSQLIDFQTHKGCFIYELTEDETPEGAFGKTIESYSLIFDKRLPKALNNDSIQLFNGTITRKGEEGRKLHTAVQIGFFSYDCEKNYDFNEFVNSPQFLSYVISPNLRNDDEFIESLKLDNFIVKN